jgi:hypothetical protein
MNNVVVFNEKNVFPNIDIVYGIIDTVGNSSTEWASVISKNVADYAIQDLTKLGYTVVVSPDEETILKYVTATNFKHIIMLTTGTEFDFDSSMLATSNFNENGDNFINVAKNFCVSNDFFIAGHILDREESYYELHQQCYILNLEIYKKYNCPKIGKIEHYVGHEEVEPLRSKDSFHDEHTPLTVSPGTQKIKYKSKLHGWNIISVALDNNLKLEVFDYNLRAGKKHYYPEHENSFLKEINFLYNRYEFCANSAISPFNSEKILSYDFPGPIEQLIVPASGLNWIKYLSLYKFQKSTVVKFYDYSLPALNFMNQVTKWDGEDYPAFVQKFLDNYTGFLSNDEKLVICGPKDLDGAWNKFKNELDWPNLWKSIQQNVTFEFYHQNLLNFKKPVNWITPGKNTIINLSNIFNYIGTTPFYSVKSRVIAENELLKKIQKINPNAYISFSRRASDGFVDSKNYNFIEISKIPLVNIEDLKKPSWHLNTDWSDS